MSVLPLRVQVRILSKAFEAYIPVRPTTAVDLETFTLCSPSPRNHEWKAKLKEAIGSRGGRAGVEQGVWDGELEC